MSNEDIVKESTPQDTKDIQVQSVCAFMGVLGYQLHVDGKFYADTYWDYLKGKREDPTFEGCDILSFNTCVYLHNAIWIYMGDDNCPMRCTEHWRFMIDAYTLNKAQAAKIVKQVFLQGTKHGRVVCHKHWVRFVDQSYQYMFLECSPEVHA